MTTAGREMRGRRYNEKRGSVTQKKNEMNETNEIAGVKKLL